MLEQLLVDYLTHLTYVAIVLIPIISSLGFPLSEELILIGSGYLAFAGIIRLDLGILLCLIGVIAGDNAGFFVGQNGGRLLQRLLPERKKRYAQKFFYRHGPKAVFFARFLIGPRFFVPLIAGASKMCWRTFFIYNSLGALFVVPIYMSIGYFVGLNLDEIISLSHQLNDIIVLGILIFAILVSAYICFYRRYFRKKIREGNFVDYWLEEDEPFQVVTFGDPSCDAKKYIAKLRKQDGKVSVVVSHIRAGGVRRFTKLRKWMSLKRYNHLIRGLAKKSKPKIEKWD